MTQPTHRLSSSHLWILGLLAGLPLLMLLGRLPGAPTADFLEQHFSLNGAPKDVQRALYHAMFLPFGALLVVMARLTFGIRLLGPFRSILLAVAFQVAGIGLGLVFLVVVLGVVAAVRPWLKQVRLPYFARVSFILGVISGTIAFSVLFASLLEIHSIRKVAYFPIIALCLLADGILNKISREGMRSALWRGATTTVLAVLIALIARTPGLKETLRNAPELVVLQLACIVVLAKYLDLRLLERFNPEPVSPQQAQETQQPEQAAHAGGNSVSERVWPLRLVGSHTNGGAPSAPAGFAPRVAVVRNQSRHGVIDQVGRQCPETYGKRSVQRVVEAFEKAGVETRLFEGDMSMLPELKAYVEAEDKSRSPVIVFNMAYGIQGNARYTHVPGMLEMAGVPYTGSDPFGHALALDKVVTKILIRDAGIPTPAFKVMHSPDDDAGDLRYPLIVKPRHESTSHGLHVVNNPHELAVAVKSVTEKFEQGALVEEFIDGREFAVSLLGNDPVEVLPIVELAYPDQRVKAFTLEDKYHKTSNEPQKLVPTLEPALKKRLEELAIACFRACHCRDYARVDFRVDAEGTPYVLEINSMASLGAGGSYVYSAEHAGYSFQSLMCRILDVAGARYWSQTERVADGPSRALPVEMVV